jgi:hypothetical protein
MPGCYGYGDPGHWCELETACDHFNVLCDQIVHANIVLLQASSAGCGSVVMAGIQQKHQLDT